MGGLNFNKNIDLSSMAKRMRLNPATAAQSRDGRLVLEKHGQIRIGTTNHSSNRRLQSLNNSEDMEYKTFNSGGPNIY